jgi:diamine N-acetyltransferase
MITIRPAGVNDIDTIHQLAHNIWPAAYKEILSKEQMDYMLDMMYSHEALQYQLETQKHEFFLASDHDRPTGFASIQPKYKVSQALYRLNKLYV